MWSFLYLMGMAPNMGARPDRRGGENWMNEPRGLGGIYRWRE
jgi:hypothetical protein